jgi:hypothetical protein
MFQWSIAVLLLLLPASASAQALPKEPYKEPEVFKILTASIDYAEKWAKDNKLGHHLFAGLRSDTGIIQKAWPSRERVDDGSYLMGLTLDSYLLDKVVKDEALGSALQALEGAAEDLGIKASQVRRDSRLITAVSVRVHTWEGWKETSGYEVSHVLAGLATVPTAVDSFRKFSSPTDWKLFAPGRYLFWARKDGKDYQRVSRLLIPGDKTPIELDLAIR